MDTTTQFNGKDPQRIAYLVSGFLRQTITEEEHDELDEWICENDENMRLFEDLTDPNNLAANLAFMDKVMQESNFSDVKARIEKMQPARRKYLHLVNIAAVGLVLITISVLLFLATGKKNQSGNQPLAGLDTSLFKPGGNRAILTTANGKTIDLEAAPDGAIADGVSKTKDGKLWYEENDQQPAVMHTLTTPVGGQYKVKLPDGSSVWLNAATALTYPSRFSGTERTVKLSGEAYFEVVKNSRQPFRVLLGDSITVNVLGTHFNVKSYSDEKSRVLTLLEGSVMIQAFSQTERLQPGMQVRFENNLLVKSAAVDTEEVMGWKNGLFVFNDASIEEITQQVQRWYGGKFIIRGKISQQFNATIRRSEPLTKLLQLLEMNGYIQFKNENEKIYVLPR